MKVKNILHLASIFVLSHLWSLKYSLFGSHISFCNYLWHLKWYSQIFYIWQWYLSFYMYDYLNIPYFIVLFIFANTYEVLSYIHKYFILGNYISSLTSIITSVFLVWEAFLFLQILWSINWLSQIFCICQPYLFLHIYNYLYILCLADMFVFSPLSITFETVHTSVSIHNANAYKVLRDNYKYFTFGSQICYFTFIITLHFLVCIYICVFSFIPTTYGIVYTCVPVHKANAYEMLSDSYKFYIWQPYLFFHIYGQ